MVGCAFYFPAADNLGARVSVNALTNSLVWGGETRNSMQEQVFNLGQKMTPEQEVEYLRRRVAEYEDEARGKCMQVRLALVKENSFKEGFSLEDTETLVQYVINGLPTPAMPDDDSIQVSIKTVYLALQEVAKTERFSPPFKNGVDAALNEICSILGFTYVVPRA